MTQAFELRERRKQRLRNRIRRNGSNRPRLSVFRSNQHIYVQVIDDGQGRTLAAASTLDKEIKASLTSGGNKDAATAVGKLIADRATVAGVKEVVFDRGPYLFHGRVKALADAAREGGLSF